MRNTILIILLLVSFCNCSQSQRKQRLNDSLVPDSTISPDSTMRLNNKYIDRLRIDIEQSSLRYINGQLSRINNNSQERKYLLDTKEKIILSGGKYGVREKFFNFLNTQIDGLKSYNVEELYLIEVAYEGEVMTFVNYLIIQTDLESCKVFKYELEDTSWKATTINSCKTNPNHFFDSIQYTNKCENGQYSAASEFIITRVTFTKVDSKVLNVVCKKHLDNIID